MHVAKALAAVVASGLGILFGGDRLHPLWRHGREGAVQEQDANADAIPELGVRCT